MEKQKFGVRDLINVGVFSVLVIAATTLGSMIGFIPVLMPLTPFMAGLFSAPIFMLYSTKIKHFGMVTITGAIITGYFMLSGNVYALGGLVIAVLADLVLKQGKYQSVKHARLSYTVMAVLYIFNLLPIYLSKVAYTKQLIEQGYGKEYATKMMSVLPDWSLIPITLLGCLGAYIGCTIGIKILKKHFEKAGMI